jgi:hypothetical protein
MLSFDGLGAYCQRLLRSAWLFPVVLTVILVTLAVLKISGSSIGVYDSYFYGKTHKDSALIAGQPRTIRSDEWVVTTQMTMAQKSDGFHQINSNLGRGEDMSVLLDVPYKDWSELFKPQNWSFFVMPFDNAFAFKWWFMGYLLILSAYVFVLSQLPRQKFLAICIALALFFSAFIQWWYEYSTLAPIYYSLFAITIFVLLLKQQRRYHEILLGVILAYVIAAFVLVLYPPFQIPCALASVCFTIGYLIKTKSRLNNRDFRRKLGVTIIALIAAGLISLLFILTRSTVIHTIQNTVYPGKRIIQSGGYDFAHLFSGHLDNQLLSTTKADHYKISKSNLTNQSESSNFLLLLPFLLVPSIYILFRDKRQGRNIDWPLLTVSFGFLVALLWLFVPHLRWLGELLLLNKVPLNRLIIGLGVLNLLQLVLVIKRLQSLNVRLWPHIYTVIYVFLALCAELALSIHAKNSYPGFIGIYKSIAFSLPIPIIIYLLLTNRFRLAMVGLLAFSCLTSLTVNPLYRGSGAVTDSQISTTIRRISHRSPGAWAVENGYLENFAVINGARSFTGVYPYPQLNLWKQIGGADPAVYNRYAHVNFNFYRDHNQLEPTRLQFVSLDHFAIDTEPCSQFIRQNNIRYLLAAGPLNTPNRCAKLISILDYPDMSTYIYEVH